MAPGGYPALFMNQGFMNPGLALIVPLTVLVHQGTWQATHACEVFSTEGLKLTMQDI